MKGSQSIFVCSVTRSNDLCNLQQPLQLATADATLSDENLKLRMRLTCDCVASCEDRCYTVQWLHAGNRCKKVEHSSTSGNRCESKKAALHSTEMSYYTGQPVCSLYCNGVATQVAKEIAPCNTFLFLQRQTAKEMGGLYLGTFGNVNWNSRAICTMQDSIQSSRLCSHVLKRICY